MKVKMTSGEIAKQADAGFEALLSENFDRVEKIALPGPFWGLK